jgi:hypothetical protein
LLTIGAATAVTTALPQEFEMTQINTFSHDVSGEKEFGFAINVVISMQLPA